MSYADDIVNGEICSSCLMPLVNAPLGFPAECADCYPNNDTAILNPYEQEKFNQRIKDQDKQYRNELRQYRRPK